MTLPLAHAGHWAVTIAYFIPVIGFMGWLAWTQIRQKRKNEQAGPKKPADG